MEHMSGALKQAVRFILSIVNTIAQIHFPGTDIPIILIMGAAWGIYFIWRFLLAQIFDMEAKK